MVWIFRSSVFKCSLAIILINKDLWSYYFCYSFTYIINRINVFITCVSLIHAIRNKNSPFFFLISFLFCFVFGEGGGGEIIITEQAFCEYIYGRRSHCMGMGVHLAYPYYKCTSAGVIVWITFFRRPDKSFTCGSTPSADNICIIKLTHFSKYR